ncbi:hypothetical protein PILCRDRAFT_322932 [Piloderma croceum F 1598]|uniref:Uncharacterized protein n=1 Tax=Piloderma croceum (strain F 1598) TaxID=765440 RepID=A0A0C3FQF2_PILCF|nr:hypothetical protein PILCRDRAFT_322932 [Piloderma croceum F 1598]
MNGLLTQSNPSFDSESFKSLPQRPPSILSLTTSTSANTVHISGIGALSGRIIYAVGEVAARGLENLAIRRRLGKITSAFPHQDYIAITDIETIYDHTLELSRFGLYRAQIRLQALRVLLVQIAMRQTHHLLRGLLKWPSIEIALFISEILTCMPVDWLPPGTDNYANLTDAYFSSQQSNENHPASPLVDFIMIVAKVNQATCQAVLRSGFLDMLLCMYACNFISSTHSVGEIRGDRNTLFEAVCAALVMLCRDPDADGVISAHPICGLWPMDQSLRILLGGRIQRRQRLWRQLGHDIVMRRISSLAKMLGTTEVLDLAELTDARIDIFEFSREDLYGLQIAKKARALMSTRASIWKRH